MEKSMVRVQISLDLSKKDHSICFQFLEKLKHSKSEFITELIVAYLNKNGVTESDISVMSSDEAKILYRNIKENNNDPSKANLNRLMELQEMSFCQIKELAAILSGNVGTGNSNSLSIGSIAVPEQSVHGSRRTMTKENNEDMMKESTSINSEIVSNESSESHGSRRTTEVGRNKQKKQSSSVSDTASDETYKETIVEDSMQDMLGNNFDFD